MARPVAWKRLVIYGSAFATALILAGVHRATDSLDVGELLIPAAALAGWFLGPWEGATLAIFGGFAYLVAAIWGDTALIDAQLRADGIDIIGDVGISIGAGLIGRALRRSREQSATIAREAERNARLNTMYALLVSIQDVVVHEASRAKLFREICQVAVEKGGARMAWIGELDGDKVVPFCIFGKDDGYVAQLGIDLNDPVRSAGPTGRAYKNGEVVVTADISSDPHMAPWREAALARGYRSSAAVPIRTSTRLATLTVYAAEPGYFSDEYRRLLWAMSQEISFTLAKAEAEDERERARKGLLEAEARFRQVAENLSEIIFLADVSMTRFHFMNEAYEAITGRPVRDLYADPSLWLDQIVEEDRERVLAAIVEGLENDRPGMVEYRVRRPDGTIRWLRARGAPVHTPDGSIYRIAGVATDVTEEKERAERERRAAEQLHEIERLRDLAAAKTSLLNMAAHELSNPLTPIAFQIEMLSNTSLGPLNAEQREAVDTLARSMDRLSRLVRDLLDASRLEAGKLTVRPAPTDLALVGRRVCDGFRAMARTAHVDLRCDAPEGEMVTGDTVRLEQVVGNLVDNAIKFTPPGGAVVVSVRAEGAEAILRVRDNGIGLSPDQIAKLFQPFSQAHDVSPQGRTGTGLGLFISRGIVEQHGGRIGVESDGPGKGSTFWVAIPLLVSEDQRRSPEPLPRKVHP